MCEEAGKEVEALAAGNASGRVQRKPEVESPILALHTVSEHIKEKCR